MQRGSVSSSSLSEFRISVNPNKPQSRLFPGACERCHRYKEKCSFDTGQYSCCRCKFLGEQCRPRARKRMGRRPVVQQPTYGSICIISLDLENQDRVLRSDASIDLVCNGPASRKHARGHFGCLSRSNVRSQHLSAVALRDSVLPAETIHSLTTCLSASETFLGSPSRLERVLGTTEGFFEVHRTFMLGRTFTTGFQHTVRRLFAHSPYLLTDAYCVAIKSMNARHTTSSSLDDCDFRTGSHCLQELVHVSSPISHVEDAAVILLLGQAMLVYNTLIPSPATHIITQGMLLHVKHWYPKLLKKSHWDAVTLTPVLMDTVECLIRREIPVIRFSTLDRCIIDRFLGVSSSLLPLLYELCERSHNAKANQTVKCTAPDSPAMDQTYAEIERKIRDWTPDLPTDFFTAYSMTEIDIMLAQARSYRIAALLTIHRLSFPLGTETAVGELYAQQILHELSISKTWPCTVATGFSFDFPLLVATLELPRLGIEVYEVFKPLRFRRQHSDEIVAFVNFVMEAKRNGYDGLWFELVHDRLHGLILT